MRSGILALCLISAAQAGIVSREWRDGRLSLKLDDGTAEMEWTSSTAFRVVRSWDGPAPMLRRITHDRVEPTIDESGAAIVIKTKYLTVELDRADLAMRVR